MQVFVAAAVVPASPLLVPPLGGLDDAVVGEVRSAAVETARLLGARAQRWAVVGVADTAGQIEATAVGTFRGFGADVRVGLSAAATGTPDPELPLAALIAGRLREQAAPAATCTAILVTSDTSPQECRAAGSALRAELDAGSEPVGVLLVADGADTLTERAPGHFHPAAPVAQAELDTALSIGDPAALDMLDPDRCQELGIAGRAGFQVLAGLFANASPTVRTLYCGAPFGVGYYAGVWLP